MLTEVGVQGPIVISRMESIHRLQDVSDLHLSAALSPIVPSS